MKPEGQAQGWIIRRSMELYPLGDDSPVRMWAIIPLLVNWELGVFFVDSMALTLVLIATTSNAKPSKQGHRTTLTKDKRATITKETPMMTTKDTRTTTTDGMQAIFRSMNRIYLIRIVMASSCQYIIHLIIIIKITRQVGLIYLL